MKIPQFKFHLNLNMIHGCKRNQARADLGLWQLSPTKQESRPEIQDVRWEDRGDAKLTRSSRSRLHFIRTLIRSSSLSRCLALRTPTDKTTRGKGKTLEGSIFSNIEQLRINSWMEALEHLSSWVAKHAPGGTEETIWRGLQSSKEKLPWLHNGAPWGRWLVELFLKWQKELLLILRSLKLFILA